MKERSIIFTGESVRAILEGRKTQTRRVVKNTLNGYFQPMTDGTWEWSPDGGFDHDIAKVVCPFGIPGDRLWVRETWKPINHKQRAIETYIRFAADDGLLSVKHSLTMEVPTRWRSPIFMPRWASRITLEITAVRVQRVQDISEEDAIAEGISLTGENAEWRGTRISVGSHVGRYAILWDSINAKRGYPWVSNPWTWALTFKLVQP